MELFEISNNRGLRIRGCIHWPQEKNPSPALLILHGFCGHKGETHIQHFAEAAQEKGIAGIRFDASGFGESEGKVENDFRVSHYLEDARVVLRYLQQHPRIIPHQIAVCGHSLGGSLAVILAAQEKSLVGCSAVQPCTKLTRIPSLTDLGTWKEEGKLSFGSELPQLASFFLPWNFAEDADGLDASEWSHLVECPFQIMYGTADVDVLPSDTLSIYKNAARGTELIKLEGIGHSFKEIPKQLDEVTKNLMDFVSDKLEVIPEPEKA